MVDKARALLKNIVAMDEIVENCRRNELAKKITLPYVLLV